MLPLTLFGTTCSVVPFGFCAVWFRRWFDFAPFVFRCWFACGAVCLTVPFCVLRCLSLARLYGLCRLITALLCFGAVGLRRCLVLCAVWFRRCWIRFLLVYGADSNLAQFGLGADTTLVLFVFGAGLDLAPFVFGAVCYVAPFGYGVVLNLFAVFKQR